ncbi:hypothetical protein EDI_348580 [Entamoeba dispar SAW760]|uniref:Uncharacterized protein n=1 Tax=Entamoeba dispar (strain ATCC PRA-260 / SAW760) TaxID=370354 RepID=B0E6H3_ENTDS|nr:uncharacterized protein EDI_348580 [Entamoeba dispar SAW760]EDR29868.1 hypothetical protein EDI_348580 [Entamoeba dispar SAW760]|eukprot:EDR29868.1 hypothetical protein EDI_348580 [Entamoeba dispar SAW760]
MFTQLEGGYIGVIQKYPYVDGDDRLWLRLGKEYTISKEKSSNVIVNIKSKWELIAFSQNAIISGNGLVIVNGKEYNGLAELNDNDVFKLEDISFQFSMKVHSLTVPQIQYPDLLLFELQRKYPSETWLEQINPNDLLNSINNNIPKLSTQSTQIIQHLLNDIFITHIDYNQLKQLKDDYEIQKIKKIDSFTLLNPIHSDSEHQQSEKLLSVSEINQLQANPLSSDSSKSKETTKSFFQKKPKHSKNLKHHHKDKKIQFNPIFKSSPKHFSQLSSSTSSSISKPIEIQSDSKEKNDPELPKPRKLVRSFELSKRVIEQNEIPQLQTPFEEDDIDLSAVLQLLDSGSQKQPEK